MPLVSVIITNYNGRRYLKDCIESLKEGSFKDFEIIVIDNGSDDDSISFLRKNYPEIKILELGENLGLSIASNSGRKLARGKYLFFYNNDTIADKNLLAELVKTMEADPKIGICGCKTVIYDGSREINCGVEMDLLGYPYGRGKPFYVDAAIFTKGEIFDKLNGFDEKMFLYCEDRDFCWCAWIYGYKVVPVPTAVFKHDSACLVNSSIFSTNIKRRFMNEAFTLRMILKNYSFLTLVLILPLYFLINFFEIAIFFIKGRFRFILKTYLSAYFWNLKNLKSTIAKRSIIQKNRKISDSQLLSHICKISGKFLLLKNVGMPKISD